jgi:hypothetical protein
MAAELTGEMALVGESRSTGNVGEWFIRAAHVGGSPLDSQPADARRRRFSEGSLELANKVRRVDARDAGDFAERRGAAKLRAQVFDDAPKPGGMSVNAVATDA